MQPKYLNRYTTLPILIDMLWRKQITLLSPQSWEDRNDAYYLERYQQEKKLGSVLALCFSGKRETFHHWRVFSHGSSGVCVEFNTKEFLTCLRGKPEFRFDRVQYSPIETLEKVSPLVGQWPFLKRLPYKDENEVRIIYESTSVGELSKPLGFDVDAIKRVTLSPWMPRPVAQSVAALLESIEGCSAIQVNRSTLIENGRWKNVLKSAVGEKLK